MIQQLFVSMECTGDPMKYRALCWFFLLVLPSFQTALSQQYRLDTLAASPNTSQPVVIAFVPGNSGTFFFTEKTTGKVRIFKANQLQPNPFVTVSVTSGGEQGLLGIAVHPQYPDSPYIYIFYTQSGNRDNIVVRYRDSNGVGVDPVPLVLVPRNNTATNHNGGNVHFGPDGKLYVTFGEYASSSNAQDTISSNLRGKILRLNPDGTIPTDNPFPGKAFWSYGHRNSFDFTFDSQTGKMYCSENGPSCDDEINLVPRGGNLGWPVDGNCTYGGSPAYVRPLYFFPSNLPALTGIVVYRSTAFPRLRGKLLFTGNSIPTLWTLTLTASGDTIVPNSFATFFTYGTGFADVEIGPDGNIYITNGPYSSNRVLRLRPIAPVFTSAAPLTATKGVQYSYTPTFNGTLPGLSIVSGPQGMFVDTTTWTVKWTPTDAQGGLQSVTLRAENGAGFDTQTFTINVPVTSIDEYEGNPKEFALHQNFPNPFNPSTSIIYSILQEGHVRMSVFDVLGREVALLQEGVQRSGTYRLLFSSVDLPSGVYFYRIQAPGFVETKKMVITK